jgi:hypothetical protein
MENISASIKHNDPDNPNRVPLLWKRDKPNECWRWYATTKDGELENTEAWSKEHSDAEELARMLWGDPVWELQFT